MACLHSIPTELVNEITAYLRPHSLTKLVRVSKKFREFAQQALWHNVELHRRDAHHDAFGLTVHRSTPRVYLDDVLRSVWSYRTVCGADLEYDRRNAKFGTAIRTLYRAAGRSQGWARLAPYVRHLCLTLTHKSSASVWNVILSLPHLATVEVIGEIGPDADGKMKAPPTVGNLRAPAAFNVRTARLRGYIPELFAPTLCEASASIITSLDLGILEGPKLWEGTAEETEFQEEMGVPLFVAPWGVLWYPMASETSLASLTHLLLCRPSDAAGPPDMSEDEDLEVRTDDNHEVEELKQWASVTKSVRSNLAELVLEQRPFQLGYLLDMDMDMGISPHDVVDHGPWSDADVSFFRHVMKVIFDDVNQWPKLVRLIFRGINFHGSEDEMGETLQAFVSRMLSGVQMSEVGGDYTFFNTRNGAIKNRHGADGLKAHLDFGIFNNADEFLFF